MMHCQQNIKNYHYSLRVNPEERSSHLLRGRSLNSHQTLRNDAMYDVALRVMYHQL
jgi:hypothetical protein